MAGAGSGKISHGERGKSENLALGIEKAWEAYRVAAQICELSVAQAQRNEADAARGGNRPLAEWYARTAFFYEALEKMAFNKTALQHYVMQTSRGSSGRFLSLAFFRELREMHDYTTTAVHDAQKAWAELLLHSVKNEKALMKALSRQEVLAILSEANEFFGKIMESYDLQRERTEKLLGAGDALYPTI